MQNKNPPLSTFRSTYVLSDITYTNKLSREKKDVKRKMKGLTYRKPLLNSFQFYF